MVNTQKLSTAINESGIPKTFIAKKLGISRTSLNLKLKSSTKFNSDEICILKDILHLDNEKFMEIFFEDVVEYKSTKVSANA